MNVNGLLTKRWLSHLESNQNSGYQKPVCSRYTMGQAELRILYHISFIRRPRVVDCQCCAGLPSNVRPRSGNGIVLVCLSVCGHGSGNGTPCAGRAICASFDPLGVYIYAVGVESSATRLPLLRSVPLTDPNRGRAWHPREFGAVLGGSASHTSSDRLRRLGLRPRVIPRSLHRRSRRLHGDTRRNASSANTPPRLATCLTAHPTNRVAACRSVRRAPPRPLPHLP